MQPSKLEVGAFVNALLRRYIFYVPWLSISIFCSIRLIFYPIDRYFYNGINHK
jgi:hypothetical protein